MTLALARRELLGATGALALAGRVTAATPDDTEVDRIVEAFRSRFEVPGIAIAMVRRGRPDLARGYGVRRLGEAAPIDAHTRFAIASNSKAFTAAALAILVDERRIGWDDPVVRYLPEFAMHDPAVTQMMTVRDLLVHCSGLGLGQGDLMVFGNTRHTPADILRGLRFLKPEHGFRAGYAYDNILYIVAGLLTERVTSQSWEDFVTTRLLVPLGMAESAAATSRLRGDNISGRHARMGPPVRGLGPVRAIAAPAADKIGSAGGIEASAGDILAWLHVQLARGRLPGGGRLWSAARADEMWKPQVITGSGPGPGADDPSRAVVAAYALGWGVQDYRGQRLVAHGGMLDGTTTGHALLPEAGAALAIYTNQEERLVTGGLRNALLDLMLGGQGFDWLGYTAARIERQEREVRAAIGDGAQKPPLGRASLPLAAYVGRYRDPWYGDVTVTAAGGALAIRFEPTPGFASPLEPWGTDAFRTRFDPQAGEDAVVFFAVDGGRVTGVTMKPLSPLADFSYDYQHLAFVPVR